MNEQLIGLVDTLNEKDLRSLYAHVTNLLKVKGYIRTRNVTGELGETAVFTHYNATPGLPNLLPTGKSTMNVDAISNKGKRYAIKTISGRTVNTGIFGGLSGSKDEEPKQDFDYVVVVVFNKNYGVDLILELTWEGFLAHKRWYKGMKGWNLTVGKKLMQDSTIIFDSGQDRSKGWRQHLY